MKDLLYYCPDCRGKLVDTGQNLRCANEHEFPFITDTKVPVLACQDDNVNEYTTAEAAQRHDNALNWLFATFGGDEATLRLNLIDKLRLNKGDDVLITGVGAGNDLPLLAKMLGSEGSIVAVDYSKQMLISAVERSDTIYGLADQHIEFAVCDATSLPFAANAFDAAYHFGGLNLFSSIAKGISEMDRVVKEGGRVVFCDEGLAPWVKDTEVGKMLINNNPLYVFDAPLKHIPVEARDVNLSWEVNNCFYVIDYTVANAPQPIDFDVPHVGLRGGTIRTRYFGNLEGVDPKLKEQIYSEAPKRGVSRVELIEKLLKDGLQCN